MSAEAKPAAVSCSGRGKVMVIGAKGFIGSAVVRRLLAAGREVCCVEPRTTPGRLGDLGDAVEIVHGDVRELEGLHGLLVESGAEAVVTLPFFRGPSLYEELEILGRGTWVVFEACRLAGVRRVIFPSSVRVYGMQDPLGTQPKNEQSDCVPLGWYGAIKRAGELIASEYNERFGMEIVAVRIAAAYGPGIREGAAGVAAAPVGAAGEGKVELPYLPEARQCLIHVDDIAASVDAMLAARPPQYAAYELGGQTVSYREMAHISEQLVPGASVDFVCRAEHPELTFAYLTDNQRLRQEFGIEHRSVEAGYREIVEGLVDAAGDRAGEVRAGG